MKFTLEIDRDMRREMKRLASAFKEDSAQATARLATSTGREMAILTTPRGNSKKIIHGAIERDARRAVFTVPPRVFTRLLRAKSPARRRVKVGNNWTAVQPHQLQRGAKEINSHIERARNAGGRVPKLAFAQMLVAPASAFKKVIRARRKLAGITKGGWIGAGRQAATFQTGGEKLTIGKNFYTWAQKWVKFGAARIAAGGRLIELVNNSPAARRMSAEFDLAASRAWRNVRLWYKRALKARERKGDV